MKYFGVLLDENLTEKEYVKYIENKCAKNIGLLYEAKYLMFTPFSTTQMQHVRTHFTNLKKLHSKQKHAMRIVHNKVKFEHTRHLFR